MNRFQIFKLLFILGVCITIYDDLNQYLKTSVTKNYKKCRMPIFFYAGIGFVEIIEGMQL